MTFKPQHPAHTAQQHPAWPTLALWAMGISLLISAAISTWGAHAIHALEARLGDAVWRLGATQTEERRLIVVDIDDRSLQTTGPWPWPRTTLAQLLDRTAALGARLQILDIVLTDPRPDDATLLHAIQKHKPVLAQVFALPDTATPTTPSPKIGQPANPLNWPTCPAPFVQAQGHLANHPALAQQALPPANIRIGHISPSLAHDGIVRHQPAIVCWQGQAYPALGLAAIMQATGENQLTPQRGTWWDAPWILTGQTQTLPRLPLDNDGNIRISWGQHPNSFISVSASDILQGKAPAELFQGAWVLIGSSAFGLNDSIATPYGPNAAGLQAHAQIITAWLDGRTPYTPRAAWAAQLAATLAGLALLLTTVWRAATTDTQTTTRSRTHHPAALLLPLVGITCATAMWATHGLLLWYAHIWIGWATPALTLLLASLSLTSAELLRNRLQRQRLYQHLSSYLPAPVAASLALQPPSGAIRAQTTQVSVLFADIRNFSAYCEARPPAEAAAVLHAFFSAASRIVQQHGGFIEAFQGDAIMAVWNHAEAPPALPAAHNHASQALTTARALLTESRRILPDPAPEGLEPLQLGIGLETGLATAGSFGLASRRTHLVMGRTVTIANRLVAMTADLAHPILIGEGMATQLGGQSQGVPLASVGTYLLDGLRTPHHVYAIPLHVLTPPATPNTAA